MTRWPDGDDEPSVEIVDDPAPARRPGRWPQLGLLGAAVAVVILVGLLDRGGDDETSLPTTTTTTRPHTTTTRRVHRVTRTTEAAVPSGPRYERRPVPLLADAADTWVVTVGANGTVEVEDLTRGDRCANDAGGQEAWIPIFETAGATVPLQTDRGLALVDRRCALRPIGLSDGYPAAMTDEAVWYMQGDGSSLREIRLDGRPGVEIDVPSNFGPNVLGVGRRLVFSAAGSITLVDPTTDERRDRGAGFALAAHDATVAVVTCPRLQCRLSLLDVDTGRRRQLADLRLGAAVAGVFSPDGRSLLVATTDEHVALVDVRSGRTSELPSAEQIVGFTADSQWILLQSEVNLVAVRPDGSDRRVLRSVAGSNGIAVLHAPRDY